MGYAFGLPQDNSQLEAVISKLLADGRSRRNPQSIKWWINAAYMNGIREFSNINYQNGTVSISYLNESGVLQFRHEGITAKYQAQLGRLEALDLSPAVGRKGVSLDGMRKSSVAQVCLDSAFSQDKVKQLTLNLCPTLLLYGTIGLGLWIENEDSAGIEVINPWELIPLPIDISGPSDVRGLMRVRHVPLEWIKNLAITPSKKSKKYKGIDKVEIPTGEMPIGLDSAEGGMLSMSAGGGGFFVRSTDTGKSGMGGKKKDELNKDITQLVEVWTETADGYLAEYAILAGINDVKFLYRHDHSQAKYPMPVRVVRDVTVGSFWGRSFVDQLIPLNHEVELALSSLFESVSDFDLYGLQLWPTTLGTPPQAQRGQDGVKRITYEPDYTAPDLKPENIMPAKMTAPQVQAINIAISLMDKISNQPNEMLGGGAPGRVDSSKGLGFLYEVSNVPLSPTAKNIADGVSGVYRAMLRILKDTWSDQKVVSISNLDDSLAGIILDAEAGTLSLSKNAIPYPDEISITIASEVPVSKEQQKMDLIEALTAQRITLEEFSFAVRKQGLNLPVGLEVEWQNYRRAMLENILLFGDGEIPGEVIVSDRDLHRVHLNVLDAFMARPEFYAASQKVRDKFAKHYDEHNAGLGVYPDQLEMPEDVAQMSLDQNMQIPQQGPMM